MNDRSGQFPGKALAYCTYMEKELHSRATAQRQALTVCASLERKI
jgi:hypothetical protein